MKKYIILLILISSSYVVKCQETTINNIKYNYVLKEKVFVHYNSSFLVSGEYLKYKIYCIRDRNKRISRFSKIAYIELVNSDKESIFKHKIRLKDGVGIGEYFLPATLKSGNYKLVSYTQAMRNEGEDYFYQGDISIVNPFKKIDKNLLVEKNVIEQKNSLVSSNTNISNSEKPNESFKIITQKDTYNNRSKVTLKLQDTNRQKINGKYSISVRKIDGILKPAVLTSKNYTKIYPKKELKKSYVTKFLPEFEGDLIIGKVLSKDTNKPEKDIRVVLTIPNEEYFLKFAQTDNEGKFMFKFKSKFSANTATIQVLNKNRKDYKVIIEKKTPKDYNTLSFNDFNLSPKIKNELLEISIQNQIENSYQSIKLDSISDEQLYQNNLLQDEAETFLLDDYTRFSTVKETILEIVKNVSTRKRKGQYSFHVAKLNPYDKETLNPLITVDGILTQNLNELAEFDAKNVKSISVIREKFNHGDFKFQGIISVITFNNSFNSRVNKDFLKSFTFSTPLKNRKYFSQQYNESNKYDRIPDYRRQLLWNPEFLLNGENETSFFTSDVKGLFEISIEGFQEDGTPVSSKKVISVE